MHAGREAYAAVFSFNGNKIITTGGGGILASDDDVLINHARKLATQARDPFPYYEHTEIGYNYRLSNLAAAVGVGQMTVLEQRVERRRQIFDRHDRIFHTISKQLRIRDLVKDDRIDPHRDIILCNNRLRRKISNLFL